jgi:hypothetical protein
VLLWPLQLLWLANSAVGFAVSLWPLLWLAKSAVGFAVSL